MDTIDIDINKYTDYDIQLNTWVNPSDKAVMARCKKSDIAKHFINCNDLYDEIINMIGDEPIDYIEEFYYEFVNVYKYFDERIMKNKIYESDETYSDTNTDMSTPYEGSDNSNMWESITDDDHSDYDDYDVE